MNIDLRYPIGRFDRDLEIFSDDARRDRIATIAQLPAAISTAVAALNDSQLDTPYRPDGWTIRQTVHHIADSHANSLIRFKLALTEDSRPTIKPYHEDRWANLGDSEMPVEVSINMIDAIHKRWTALLTWMAEGDFQKTFYHPETGEWTLDAALALYEWHSRHHTAHITYLRQSKGW